MAHGRPEMESDDETEENVRTKRKKKEKDQGEDEDEDDARSSNRVEGGGQKIMERRTATCEIGTSWVGPGGTGGWICDIESYN